MNNYTSSYFCQLFGDICGTEARRLITGQRDRDQETDGVNQINSFLTYKTQGYW